MATIKDIARHTGMSVSTVSVVLRDETEKFGIKAATAAKIRRAAAELGYAKNAFARVMASGRSRVLAFVAAHTTMYEYTGRTFAGLLDRASQRGYAVQMFPVDFGNPEPTFRKLSSFQVEGVAVFGGERKMESLVAQLAERNFKCATVNMINGCSGFGVNTADADGVRELVRHLSSLGHRNIAYSGNRSDTEFAHERRRGYREGMAEFVPEGRSLVIPEGTDHDHRLLLNPRSLTESGFTAVIAETDHNAALILQAALADDLHVPEQLAVTGFAGTQVARFAGCDLTTALQPFEAMGERGAELLIDAIEGKIPYPDETPHNEYIPVALHVGSSTVKKQE